MFNAVEKGWDASQDDDVAFLEGQPCDNEQDFTLSRLAIDFRSSRKTYTDG